MKRISILGLGPAGGALAISLQRSGFAVGPLIYRHSKPRLDDFADRDFTPFGGLDGITADTLIIATADQDLRATAEALAAFDELPPVALHLSGSLSSDEIGRLRDSGVAIGSMHPLVSISEAMLGADSFLGAFFCIEGDERAVSSARSIAEKLGANHFSIESKMKPLYHASAVMASGNVTALFDVAIEMLSKCGLDSDRAFQVLMPLLQSTVDNLAERSPSEALTGPFARGDIGALERHLDAFEGTVDDSSRSIYLELAERSVQIAGRANRGDLLAAISMAKHKTGC